MDHPLVYSQLDGFPVVQGLCIKVMFYVNDKSFLRLPESYNYEDSCELREEDER